MQVPRGFLRPRLSHTSDRTNQPCYHKFESANEINQNKSYVKMTKIYENINQRHEDLRSVRMHEHVQRKPNQHEHYKATLPWLLSWIHLPLDVPH